MHIYLKNRGDKDGILRFFSSHLISVSLIFKIAIAGAK